MNPAIYIAALGLLVSVMVGIVALLSYVNNKSVRKEASLDKFAKAAGVDSELVVIRDDISDAIKKLDDHGAKISALQSQGAVLVSQVAAILKETEKLSDKLDDLR